MAAKMERTRTPGIYKRGGRYVVVWRDRGRQRKQFYRTLEEAREAKGRRQAGDRQPTSRLTLTEYFDEWIDSYGGRTVRGLEDTTRENYRWALEEYVLPDLGPLRLRDLRVGDLRSWMRGLERRGVPPATIDKAKRSLSALLATAHDDEEIQGNPLTGLRYVPSPEARRRHPKPKRRKLTVADVDAILAALEPKWRLLFELLAHSGLRIGELLGLRWENVHLGDDPRLRIREQVYRGERKRLKTEASDRDVPLSSSMARNLAEVRGDAPPDAPVFATRTGRPFTYGNVYNRALRPALRKCGIAAKVGVDERGRDLWDYRGIAFHAFRKACGSILLQRAGKHPKQVQGWLGHSRLSTTMDIYQHELDDGLGSADALDEILGGQQRATRHPETAGNGNGAEATNSALESEKADQPQPAAKPGSPS